jgi:cytochrome c oxidase subunit 1
MFGRMMNEPLGKIHFWLSFIGVNCVFFPMHSLGVVGHLRRIFNPAEYAFLEPILGMNQFISVAAICLGTAQLLFIFNFIFSIWKGPKAPANPWNATTLEWTLPSPPGHGNFGDELPVVNRWAFDYGLPGASEDFVMQTEPGGQGH